MENSKTSSKVHSSDRDKKNAISLSMKKIKDARLNGGMNARTGRPYGKVKSYLIPGELVDGKGQPVKPSKFSLSQKAKGKPKSKVKTSREEKVKLGVLGVGKAQKSFNSIRDRSAAIAKRLRADGV